MGVASLILNEMWGNRRNIALGIICFDVLKYLIKGPQSFT